jgi:hypothetical protein
LSKALWGNVSIAIFFCDLFLLFPLSPPSPIPLPLPLPPTQLGNLSQRCRKGRGRSQAHIWERVVKLENELKNAIDAVGKASDAEKERYRATLERVSTYVVSNSLSAFVWCDCVLVCRNNRTLFGCDHSYRVSLIHFSPLSAYCNFRLKTLFSRGNEREGRNCACLTWRAWLGLPFDLLISAILKQLCARGLMLHISKVYFSFNFLDTILTLMSYLCPEMIEF